MNAPTGPCEHAMDPPLSAYGPVRATVAGTPLTPDEVRRIDSYWRASLCLCVDMLYLQANPLLREPLSLKHTKPRLLGHWGSDAGQCFTYIHFNRLIRKYDLSAIFVSGPGHGAPAVLSQAYLEGTYSEIYPDKSEGAAGMHRFFKQLPGVVFLSGGQEDRMATAHPDAINRMPGPKPWKISFSYGRALQDQALEAWHGREENLTAGWQALRQRARCNSAASLGKYTDEMEAAPLGADTHPHRRHWHDD
jgi:hypothetical protein